MKQAVIALCMLLLAVPADAQLGGIMNKAKKAKDTADKVKDIVISESDERKIGEKVSDMVRVEFGVYQDPKVAKYVTLVGTVLAKASSRPDLKWEFIVLDTEGVNAFASPGGLVHITKGALGLIKSEAELAGVLSHEIAHITKRHTVNAIRKNKSVELAADIAPGSNAWIEGLANKVYDDLVEKGFDRGDENDADEEGLRLANKATYNPAGLPIFLTKLAERNKEGGTTRNGLFASHPETQERIKDLAKQINSEKLNGTAKVESRYTSNITFDVKPLGEIAALISGTRGVAGDGKATSKEDEKKKAGLASKLKLSSGKQAESTQASASAGNRAVGTDRHAPGGSNPNKVAVPLTPAEIEAFKKGIAA